MNKKQEFKKKALHGRNLNSFQLANHLFTLAFCFQAGFLLGTVFLGQSFIDGKRRSLFQVTH